MAFERIGTTLRFLGGTEVTDYMGPVALPEAQEAMAGGALGGAPAARRLDRRGPPRAPGGPSRGSGCSVTPRPRTGMAVEETEDQNGVAPFLPLAATWDGYLEGLPAKLRHEIKRKARKLEAETGTVRDRDRDRRTTLIPFLDRFVELHRMSEGPKGVFMQPGMEIFFRRLGEAFGPRGIFRLTFIEVGGVKAAGTIGFCFGGTFFLYNSAFDRELQQLAPGMVLVAEDIRLAIEDGCDAFDLLKGDYSYKYRFGAHPAGDPAVDRPPLGGSGYRRSRARSRPPP